MTLDPQTWRKTPSLIRFYAVLWFLQMYNWWQVWQEACLRLEYAETEHFPSFSVWRHCRNWTLHVRLAVQIQVGSLHPGQHHRPPCYHANTILPTCHMKWPCMESWLTFLVRDYSQYLCGGISLLKFMRKMTKTSKSSICQAFSSIVENSFFLAFFPLTCI